ncbi:hypothetical protein ACJ77P_12945 [Syntrophus buswellii]|uniref:hypothetical protein n=1 Tax=Syntrophus buswellii TaxID=43774 RepID=UPI0038D4E03E
MNNLQQCHCCGGYFPDEAMADWTICFHCKKKQMEEIYEEEVFIDSLGICWTRDDIEQAGGIEEISKMASEADARK